MELCCPLGILTGNSASWNTRENRCHLQQNSTHSLGTYPFSRRLLILAMWIAAGSSATDACREESFWKPDTGVNLICSLALGRWIGGTRRGSSAADCPLGITSGNGELLPWKQCQKGARCALGNTCITISLNCLLEVVLVGGYVKAETFKNAEQYAHNTQS